MAIWNRATESDQILGSNRENMFTTEVTELTARPLAATKVRVPSDSGKL